MDNRVVFGILMLLLNGIGVPDFLQGNSKNGIIKIVLYVVTCGIVGLINEIMGIIEGIKILQMSDEEYAAKKGTFDVGFPKANK